MTDRVFQATEPNPFTSATANQNQAAQRKLLELRGTANQLERYLAGLLPDDELLALARNVLFAPFAGCKRWSKLSYSDVVHRRGGCRGDVAFTTRPAPNLTADEWAMYKTIRDIAATAGPELAEHGATTSVDVVEHVGICAVCGNEVFGRAASVRIEWAGRPLSREYSLEVT